MSDGKGEWNPGTKYRTLLAQIQKVLENGEERTVRDVYYALEARGDKWEYRYVKRAVKKGRRCGYIDPSQIIDSSRQPVNTVGSGFTDPREFLDSRIRGIWKQYSENPWDYQDTYVEVWLEKQSLATVFQPICAGRGVRLEATRGDWSDSKVYEAAQRLNRKVFEGKDIHILYFGDFNPSGYHAPVSILDTLGYYGLPIGREFPGSDDPLYYDAEWGLPKYYVTDDAEELGSFDFYRCAINLEHIERFDLPENPVPSSSDKDSTIKKWFTEFVSEGEDTNVELNALKEFEREFLETLIRDEIDARIDTERWNAVNERMEQARDALADTVEIRDGELDDRFSPPILRDGEGGE